MKIIFFAFIIPFISGYIVGAPGKSNKVLFANKNNINEVLKYKETLQETSYGELLNKIDAHEISKVYFTKNLDAVISEKTTPDGDILTDYSVTKINPFITNSLAEKTSKEKVDAYFLQVPESSYLDNAIRGTFQFADSYVFPFLFITFIISLFRGGPGMPNGLPGFSSKKPINADKLIVSKSNITINSFAGSEEIFEECTEIVSYLKNDTIYKAAGAEIPKGILLEGPPGTGKTLLAKAIASEAEANFISIAASEFVELFVGMGAAKIRDLFKQARENTPCIIFIDEIDAVGRQRGAGINLSNDEREQTLNQLLAEMDGFADNDGVLIIAATNRKDVLDSALLRPGRFDRQITVPLPDKNSRKAIFQVHSKNKNLSPDINFETFAELTGGFSGAQIKNILNEAAIFAARKGNTIIKQVDMLNALDKSLVGLIKRNDTRSSESRLRVAIHEIGHALLVSQFNSTFELKKVTIQSTYNGAGGYTMFNEYQNITESGLYTKRILIQRLIIGMGGKAAEQIFYGDEEVSLGATQDLKQSNALAQQMIGNYGMGEKLETFYNENVGSDRNPFLGRTLGTGYKYSEKIKEISDKEALALVNNAYQKAKELLAANKSTMTALVDELLKKNTLYPDDFNIILQNLSIGSLNGTQMTN
jgi:cell division protease FtsH